jgi:hypothetical protein
MKEDVSDENFGIYVDTWDFEDNYSHNDIEIAREEFIRIANGYFRVNMIDYEAREVCENVYIFNKNTGERLYN